MFTRAVGGGGDSVSAMAVDCGQNLDYDGDAAELTVREIAAVELQRGLGVGRRPGDVDGVAVVEFLAAGGSGELEEVGEGLGREG